MILPDGFEAQVCLKPGKMMKLEVEMYIDPNTGGMLFQVLAVMFGALSGIVLLFASRIRMVFARVMRYFRAISNRGSEETSNQP
jgi:hypothetical protein